MTGFHFTGKAVSVLPEQRFPFYRIPGFRGPEYSTNTLDFPVIIMYNVIMTCDQEGVKIDRALRHRRLLPHIRG